MSPTLITRRTFLRSGVSTTAAICASSLFSERFLAAANGQIPHRPLGKTGVNVSLLGLGGWHIGIQKDPADSIRLMHAAIDEGVTFFDNAWEYNNGESERRMGDAIHDRRDKVFLMTKVCFRDAQGAMSNLEDSLRRLRTDHLDLWQFHEVINDEDPDRIFARGGAVETALEAKKQGKVRFIGFTGHRTPQLLLKMLDKDFPWDAVQMPLNVMDAHYQSFQQAVLPVLLQRGIGVIAMKTMGGHGARMIADGLVTPSEALRYVFSLPVATVVSGMTTLAELEKNVETARTFKPMSQEEAQALLERVKLAAATGRYEPFKSPTGSVPGYHMKGRSPAP